MGPLGWQETVFIFILALLIFGPKKLPELGKTLGKAMTEFRRASSELKSTFDREMSNLERETQGIKEATNVNLLDSHSYDSSYYDSGNYSGNSGYESHDSTATNSSTVSASATQGAQSTTAAQPEGTIAQGSAIETSANGSIAAEVPAPAGGERHPETGTSPSPDPNVKAV
jgi:TatA/E family protein of Tat protein translocase